MYKIKFEFLAKGNWPIEKD